jgi:hypothetical protein
VYPKTTSGQPEEVKVYPGNDGKVFIDGGYLAYWVANTTDTGLPLWVDDILCGAYVRVEDVEVVQ